MSTTHAHTHAHATPANDDFPVELAREANALPSSAAPAPPADSPLVEQAMMAVVTHDATDPLVKAMDGGPLTAAEAAEAAAEVEAVTAVVGPPPAEVVAELEKAGVRLNGPAAKPTGSHAQKKAPTKKEKAKARRK